MIGTHLVHGDHASCECYGDLKEDSNLEIVCEDEEDDFIWCLGNTDTDKPFDNWKEVIDFFYSKGHDTIIEINAI